MTNYEPDKDIKNRTYKFGINVLKVLHNFPNTNISRPIIDQLVRAATSIGANVIEAHYGSSKKDFINFMNIGRRSAKEIEYWLSVC